MKNLITIIILFCASISFAQNTAYDILNSHRVVTKGKSISSPLSASSLANPWIGAGSLYNISGDVSGSFISTVHVMNVVASGERWMLPVIGNVTATQDTAESGYDFGLAPFYVLTEGTNLKLLAHGLINYKILNRAEQGQRNEFKFSAGLEAVINPKDGGNSLTLSVAPEFVMNTGDVENQRWGLSLTGVLPIGNGLGILAEGLIPFETGLNNVFAIGVITNWQLK